MENLNATEQRELQGRLEKRQMREFMQTYSKIVQKCFDDCVNDFTTKSLTTREEGCVVRCVDKWLKGQERVSTRFQELNAEMMQGGRPGGQIPGR